MAEAKKIEFDTGSPEYQKIADMTAEERQQEFNRLGQQIDLLKETKDVSDLVKQREIIFHVMQEKDGVITRFGE